MRTRFGKTDFRKLLIALKIEPRTMVIRYREPKDHKYVSAELALAVVLRRLAYPCSWTDLEKVFGRSASSLSLLFDQVLDDIYDILSEYLLDWHPRLYNHDSLSKFFRAIFKYDSPDNIWGFVEPHYMVFDSEDSTPLPEDDAIMSWQIVTTPDGLVSGLDGAHAGKVEAMDMFLDSRVPDRNLEMMEQEGRRRLHLWGDSSYKCDYGVMAPWSGNRRSLSALKVHLYEKMTRLRIGVEHVPDVWSNRWTYNSFKEGPHGAEDTDMNHYFRVAVLSANCKTCLDGGNEISMKFDMDTPSLEEYFGL